LKHFVFIWLIFYGFGIMHQQKSGNPGDKPWSASDSHRKPIYATVLRPVSPTY
jgi:hypothetical protein